MSGEDRRALEKSRQALADIAAEAWRLDRAVDRALEQLLPRDADRLESQYRWFRRKVYAALEDADMRVVDLTGQSFTLGMAATPLNADEFDDEALVVTQTIEPVIMAGGEVLRTGAVMLGREAR